MLGDSGCEISGLPLQGCDFAMGEQFDISVPSYFDQFRRDNAHRTVIGGEGFIQLGHGAANRYIPFDHAKAGRVDINAVRFSLFDNLGITGDDFHARFCCGSLHRFDNFFQ